MKKKFLFLLLAFVGLLTLTGCWPGEIAVETEFDNLKGAGTRTIVLDVMDDTLSETLIPNPDDPDGVKDKGAVINDKHIVGGIAEIQSWLEENAPEFITVETMRTEGYHRYFTLTYSFDSFEEFMEKYEDMVNLSTTMSWEDFDDTEKPSWTVTGNKVVFKESKVIFEASIDWAIDGIYNNLYDAADLAGYVGKADISVFANYKVTLGDGYFEELQHFDPEAPDGEDTGKMIFIVSEDFEVEGAYPKSNLGLIIGSIAGGVVIILGIVIALVFYKKKKVA